MYQYLQLIGKGGQGEVWKVLKDGKLIALKIVNLYNISNEEKEFAKKELEALETISRPICYPFLTCYYGHKFEEGKLFIEMEYIDGVTLDVWAKRYYNNPYALYYNLLLLLYDLSRTLNYIHQKGIIHRDLKPGNILITSDNIPKIIDFGLSCFSKNRQTKICLIDSCCIGNPGTPIYMAPETILTSKSFFATDMWSLGATIFQLATGNLCFNFKNRNDFSQGEEGEKEYIQSIVNTIGYNSPLRLTTANNKLNKIVNACLIKDPTKRITADQILKLLRM